jgi:hypothetical protein
MRYNRVVSLPGYCDIFDALICVSLTWDTRHPGISRFIAENVFDYPGLSSWDILL